MLTAIAIDDEPNALEVIQQHCDKVPFLELNATFRDALGAIDWLQEHTVDVVFLDINMPHLSGLKFRNLVGEKQMIIFTTAYSEYAVESYEMNAVDYLLKPIPFPRFLQAAMKANQLKQMQEGMAPTTIQPENLHTSEHLIYVKSGSKLYKLNVADILYLEKDGNYIFFHTEESKVMSRMSMAQALELLPDRDFMQVHKSWIIGLRKVKIVESQQVVIAGRTVPVAKSYREALMERLRGI